MNMKFLCGVAALIVAGTSQAAFADDAPAAAAAAPTPEFTITGSAAVVSQYRFRGISQSDNRPAFQGSVTVTDKSGFYVAAWGSSGAGDKFYDDGVTAYASPNDGTEIDVYGGYSKTVKGFTIDGGGYGYLYPNRPEYNLYEIYGDISKAYGPLGFKVGLNWAPKQHYFTYNNTATHYSMYEYGETTFTPTEAPAVTVHGHIGHTGGGLNYIKEYVDYVAGVSYKWKALTFDISGVGTNIGTKSIRKYLVAGGAAEDDAVEGSEANQSLYRPAKSVAVVSVTANF